MSKCTPAIMEGHHSSVWPARPSWQQALSESWDIAEEKRGHGALAVQAVPGQPGEPQQQQDGLCVHCCHVWGGGVEGSGCVVTAQLPCGGGDPPTRPPNWGTQLDLGHEHLGGYRGRAGKQQGQVSHSST